MTAGPPHPTSRPPGVPAGSPGGPPGSGAHPDLDTLADLDAGVLDAEAAARVSAHVAGCADCAGVIAALEAVRADLRGLAPPPLPDSVAARLDATLAGLHEAELAGADAGESVDFGLRGAGPTDARSGRHAASAGRTAPGSGRTGDSDPAAPGHAGGAGEVADLEAARERRRARGLRVGTWVAASAVVATALFGVGSAVLQKDSTGGGATAQSSALDQRTYGRSSTRPQAGAGAGRDSNGSTGKESAPAPARLPSYDRITLPKALPRIEASSAVDVVTTAGAAGPAAEMADSARRDRCAASIGAGQPAAVQLVVFEGRVAFVFVYAGGPAGRSVVVVGTGCGLGDGADVIFRTSG